MKDPAKLAGNSIESANVARHCSLAFADLTSANNDALMNYRRRSEANRIVSRSGSYPFTRSSAPSRAKPGFQLSRSSIQALQHATLGRKDALIPGIAGIVPVHHAAADSAPASLFSGF